MKEIVEFIKCSVNKADCGITLNDDAARTVAKHMIDYGIADAFVSAAVDIAYALAYDRPSKEEENEVYPF